MIRCREINAMIEKLLNHEMNRKERRLFQKHIRQCPNCQAELEKWKKVEDTFSDLPELKCPDEVLQSIYANTCGLKQKAKRGIQFQMLPKHVGWKWAGVGVAVGLIILLTVVYPILNKNKIKEIPYSQEEILKAREQAKWSLAYVSQVLQKSEKEAIDEALMIELPQTVRKVVKNTVPILKGGS
jgi:hypothetical protein